MYMYIYNIYFYVSRYIFNTILSTSLPAADSFCSGVDNVLNANTLIKDFNNRYPTIVVFSSTSNQFYEY